MLARVAVLFALTSIFAPGASAAPVRIDDESVIDAPAGFSVKANAGEAIVTYDAAPKYSLSLLLPGKHGFNQDKAMDAARTPDVKTWASWKSTNVTSLHIKPNLANGASLYFYMANSKGSPDFVWAGQLLRGGVMYAFRGRLPNASEPVLNAWYAILGRVAAAPVAAAPAAPAPNRPPDDEPKGVPLLR